MIDESSIPYKISELIDLPTIYKSEYGELKLSNFYTRVHFNPNNNQVTIETKQISFSRNTFIGKWLVNCTYIAE